MEYVNSFDTFKANQQPYLRPTFAYNPKANCVRINDHFLFLETGVVLEKNDAKLNELFGIDFSSIIPKSTSDWVHAGVDGASVIASMIPGVGNGVSAVIDVLHAASYFVEGYSKNNEESQGLYITGGITGVVALLNLVPVPGVRAIGGSFLKWAAKMMLKFGTGYFLFAMLKFFLKKGFKAAGYIISLLFKFEFMQKGMMQIISKHQGSTWFKAMSKIPVVKETLEFIKKDISKYLLNVAKLSAKELDLYKVAVRGALPALHKASYKTLDTAVSSFVDEKTYIRLSNELAEKELAELSAETLAKNPDALLKYPGKVFHEGVAQATQKELTRLAVKVSAEVDKELADQSLKRFISGKAIKREALEYAIKNGEKNIPYESLLSKVIKRLSKESLATLPAKVLKRFGIVLVKTAITGPDQEEEEKKTEDDNQPVYQSDLSVDDREEDYTPSERESEEDDYSEIASRFGLKKGSVSALSNLGEAVISFRTPNRTRREDDDSGRMILEESDIFFEKNLTATMTDYQSSESLLMDLKLVGKKREGKERIRESEYRKWQKSAILSTPYVKSERCRYEFYFLVRERSLISFFKKNHQEEIDLARLLTSMDGGKDSAELNGSMFIIVRKVTV